MHQRGKDGHKNVSAEIEGSKDFGFSLGRIEKWLKGCSCRQVVVQCLNRGEIVTSGHCEEWGKPRKGNPVWLLGMLRML